MKGERLRELHVYENVYLTMFGEDFQIWGVQRTGKGILRVKKLKVYIFTQISSGKNLPRLLYHMKNSLSSPPHFLRHQREGNYLFPFLIQHFLKVCFVKLITSLSFVRYKFNWEDLYVVHSASMLYFIWCISPANDKHN